MRRLGRLISRAIFWLILSMSLFGCSLLKRSGSPADHLTDQQRFLQASARGDVSLGKQLLSQGARIDDAGAGGTTALMTASYRGHTQFVEFLLNRSASLELRDDIGQTALHHAALGGRSEVIGLLLAAGIEPNSHSAMGLTPLMLAVRSGDLETVSRLLAAGADPELTEPTGWNSYFFAVSRGNRPIVLRLLSERRPDFRHQDIDGQTLLHIAALYRHADLYRELLKLASDSRIKNKDGKTAQELARELNLAGR